MFDKGITVWIRFSIADKLHRTYVSQFFRDYDDDVVVLRLENPLLPYEIEVARLGAAIGSMGYGEFHKFRSFGYRRLKDYQGLPAMGEIVDFTDKLIMERTPKAQ